MVFCTQKRKRRRKSAITVPAGKFAIMAALKWLLLLYVLWPAAAEHRTLFVSQDNAKVQNTVSFHGDEAGDAAAMSELLRAHQRTRRDTAGTGTSTTTARIPALDAAAENEKIIPKVIATYLSVIGHKQRKERERREMGKEQRPSGRKIIDKNVINSCAKKCREFTGYTGTKQYAGVGNMKRI